VNNSARFNNDMSILNTYVSNDTINLNSNTLTLGSSAASTGTLTYTSGYVYGGTFTRWFGTAALAHGNTRGLFHMGTANGELRNFLLSYPSALSAGGSMSIAHTNSETATLVSIADGPGLIQIRHEAVWAASIAGFTGVAGTPFNLRAGGTGFAVGDIEDLRIMRLNDVVGTAGTNLGTTDLPVVVRTGLSRDNLGSDFYLGSVNKNSSPLPVTLLDFTASVSDGVVHLNWVTATEVNNDYFTVERSRDASNFEAFTTVAGAGNSNQRIFYSASDTDQSVHNIKI
jgi:hypothetical protein